MKFPAHPYYSSSRKGFPSHLNLLAIKNSGSNAIGDFNHIPLYKVLYCTSCCKILKAREFNFEHRLARAETGVRLQSALVRTSLQ